MRLSLKAKVLSLAVLPVLLFALVISLTTLFILQEQAHKEVEQTANACSATPRPLWPVMSRWP
jgi:signal transduction histidine kinase